MGCIQSTTHPIFKSDVSTEVPTSLLTGERHSLPTFTLFPSLPPEIRLKIWSLASTIPRSVHISVSFSRHRWSQQGGGYRFEHDYSWRSSNPTPPVLHTSREARSQALLHYRLGFGSEHDLMATFSNFETDHGIDANLIEVGLDVVQTDIDPPKVYFNPNIDMICISARRSGLLPMSGLVAILRECAENGTRILGLRLSPSIGGHMRHAHEWTHLVPLGLISRPPWKNTEIESITFYNKDGELDIPITRGGLTMSHLGVETAAEDERDAAVVICGFVMFLKMGAGGRMLKQEPYIWIANAIGTDKARNDLVVRRLG